MKLLFLGVVLVLYAMFLTPAYFEPLDLVISSGYIVMANEMGIDPILVYAWAMSGYVALVAGVLLGVGGTLIHFRHLLLISLVALSFGGILFYWFFIASGIVS